MKAAFLRFFPALLLFPPLSLWAGWSFTYTPAGPGAGSCSPPVVTVPQCSDFGGGGSCSGFATLSECEAARLQVEGTQKTCGNGKLNTYSASPCSGSDSGSGGLSDSVYGRVEFNNAAQGKPFFSTASPYSDFEHWLRESRMRWKSYVNQNRPAKLVIPESEFSHRDWFKASRDRWKWYLQHARTDELDLPDSQFSYRRSYEKSRLAWEAGLRKDPFDEHLRKRGAALPPAAMREIHLANEFAQAPSKAESKPPPKPVVEVQVEEKVAVPLRTQESVRKEERWLEERGIQRDMDKVMRQKPDLPDYKPPVESQGLIERKIQGAKKSVRDLIDNLGSSGAP